MTSFYPILPKLFEFNDIIKSNFNNYIDLSPEFFFNNSIRNEYLNFNFKNETLHTGYQNFMYDPIHLKNNVGDLLFEKIKENIEDDFEEFKTNLPKKFNCYLC
jgi:hypothetical protein